MSEAPRRRRSSQSRRPGVSRITGADYPGVIRPVMGALIDKYPYAESRRAEILANIDSISLDIGEDTWQDEEMEFSVARSVFTTLGLPPDMPVQIFEVDRGLEILADLTNLAGQDVANRILIAIEAATKVPVLPAQRPVVLQALAATLKGKTVAYIVVNEGECNRFFGEVNWRKHLTNKPAGEEGEDGAVIFTAGGAFQPSSDLSDKDRKMVEEVMTKLFGAAKADPKAPALQLSKGEVDLLRQLSKDPKRLEAIRDVLKAARQAGKGAPSLADILQSAAAAVEFREWAKLLNVPLGGGSGEEPIVKRPVHGVIINKTGELVPKQEARFSFQELDVVDAFRVPMVNIKWVAVPETSRVEVPDPAKVIRREGTYYAALGEESGLNDKTFQVELRRGPRVRRSSTCCCLPTARSRRSGSPTSLGAAG